MADRVTCRLKTDGWEKTLRKLKRQAIDPQGFVALALGDVARQEAEPGMREKTPRDDGDAQAAWKTETPKFKRSKAYIEIVNAVRAESGDFYAVFLEHGTLGRRKKKLKKGTEERRRQKLAKAGAGSRYAATLESSGGIKPRRMVRKTLNEIRKRGSVPKAMQKHLQRSIRDLRREVRSVSSG